MTRMPADANWPKLLSLAVHELRTPATVVAGYLRMVLKERAGPLPDAQRKLLEEAEKSCGRLSGLLAEMSELAHLEIGDAPVQRQTVDLAGLVREVVAAATSGPDQAPATLREEAGAAMIEGDATRLRAALGALLRCVQRELPGAAAIIVWRTSRAGEALIAIGEEQTVAALTDGNGHAPFDELRGGMGMALPLAQRVIDRHGGRLAALPDQPRAGVLLTLPLK
jgi:signal transduction histidine kinase